MGDFELEIAFAGWMGSGKENQELDALEHGVVLLTKSSDLLLNTLPVSNERIHVAVRRSALNGILFRQSRKPQEDATCIAGTGLRKPTCIHQESFNEHVLQDRSVDGIVHSSI